MREMIPPSLSPELTDIRESLAAIKAAVERPGVSPASARWLDQAGAEAYLHVSGETIRQWVAGGKLKVFRPCRGRVLYDRRDLDALVESTEGKELRKGRGRYTRRRPVD